MRAIGAALFLVLTASLAGPSSAPSATPRLVFTNVNVVDVRDGSIDRDMTVVVSNGRIDAIARVGLIGSERNIHIVNASGKFLIPGLWDMHVHSAGGPGSAWDENLIYPLYIANGVTGIRDMGGDPGQVEARRRHIADGVVPGPHMVAVGPFLNGGKGDAQTVAVNSPAEARAAVDSLKSSGVDFVKVLSNLSRDTYTAIAQECARQHMRLVGHVPDTVSVAEASADGQRSIEHLSGFLLACSSQEAAVRQERVAALTRGDGPAYSAAGMKALETYDPAKAYNLFVQLSDHNTYQVPTLVWWQANAALDDPALKSDPRLRFVPAAVRADWDPAKDPPPPGQMQYLRKSVARYREIVRAMHQAGVPIMAGTDGPDPYVYPGFSLHDELEQLVQSGFTPMQALQAATFYPALFLAKLDLYGVVEQGHSADLVLLDADPVADIRNTRRIDAVVVGGKYYAREDLDRMLSRAEELAARP